MSYARKFARLMAAHGPDESAVSQGAHAHTVAWLNHNKEWVIAALRLREAVENPSDGLAHEIGDHVLFAVNNTPGAPGFRSKEDMAGYVAIATLRDEAAK